MSKQKLTLVSILAVFALLFAFSSAAFAVVQTSEGPTYTKVWDGRGTDSLDCSKVGEGDRTEDGWIHWVFSTKGKSNDATLTLTTLDGTFKYEPGEPLNANVWHFYTPYFDLDNLTATIELFGGAPGRGGGLVISDYCPGVQEKLTVSKTVVTSYIRTHEWDIDKKVETENGYMLAGYPKIWLYTDGDGDETATWTVDVTYVDYNDHDFNVYGVITIVNSGQLDAVITDVDDVLGGTSIDVDCGVEFPYTLLVGSEPLTCTYDEDGYVEGVNEVTVTTERDEYSDAKEIIWGDPTTEINRYVEITDTNPAFADEHGDDYGKVILDAHNYYKGEVIEFTYTKDFAYDVDYAECGSFPDVNTAEVIGDDDVVLAEASATLKVNVQCLIFEDETAWAANADKPGEFRYNIQPGNWATYVEYAEKTTNLFAGQTIPVGTVDFSAPVNGYVTITVYLTGDWEFEDVAENLKVQDYADAPSGNPSPGLFDHKETCDVDESTCTIVVPKNDYYGVHVDVGEWIPDPEFGPDNGKSVTNGSTLNTNRIFLPFTLSR